MDFKEREIELKYLNQIIDRLTKKGDYIYLNSPDHAYRNYAFEASSRGCFDPAEEERLEEEAFQWRKSLEAAEYVKIVEDLNKLLSLKNKLEQEQVDHVIDKYNLKDYGV